MSEPATPLTLPSHLPFPLTITRLLARPSSQVSRGVPLLEYAFTSDTSRRELDRVSAWSPSALRTSGQDEDARENDMVGVWESAIQGEVVRWDAAFRPGLRVGRKHAGYDRANTGSLADGGDVVGNRWSGCSSLVRIPFSCTGCVESAERTSLRMSLSTGRPSLM